MPVVLLLMLGRLVFSAIVLACEHFCPLGGQVFQVYAGLLTGFSGAFFMRVKPKNADTEPPTPTHTTTTVDQDAKTVVQETQVGAPPTLPKENQPLQPQADPHRAAATLL